ncbi:primase C-terminal domain-containing protein [Ligilactobacillus saerimneri]|uniref:primase C-terminal domain-containing protein n=1 Tax=Ligilactobacillus saerimneri TaxID=228229 RepID=UPI0022A65EB3|nr:primase C-terminal domain-containing protein [Ligilactobacillus saerimneri]MCZ0890987.1 primase C-terminal domain-containing protein [Ligilactobacillus saerimneri]
MPTRQQLIEMIVHQDSLQGRTYGTRFAFRQKSDLATQTGTLIHDVARLTDDTYTHWTPNAFLSKRTGRYQGKMYGHAEENLKLITTFVVDIDSKHDVNGNLIKPRDFYLLDKTQCAFEPTAVLSTPHGFQVYYVLKTPVYINAQKHSISVAKRVSENLRQYLVAQGFPIDLACNHFGIARTPNSDNIALFTPENTIDFKAWVDWSTKYDGGQKPASMGFQAVKTNIKLISQPWYKLLINAKQIAGTKGQIGRNNAIFTLALANYCSGVAEAQALRVMQVVNGRFADPLTTEEVARTVKSAYSGAYTAPKKSFIKKLVHTYVDPALTDKDLFVGGIWTHFKKDRADRQRSHYAEWIGDLVDFLTENCDADCLSIKLTTAELQDLLGIGRSSLAEVKKALQGHPVLKLTTVRGRFGGVVLSYTDRQALLLLHEKQAQEKHKNATQLALFVVGSATQDEGATMAVNGDVASFYQVEPRAGTMRNSP